MKHKMIAATFAAALAVVALSACDVDSTSDTKESKGSSTGVLNDSEEAKDVKIVGVDGPDAIGVSYVKLRVTNSSSKTSDYMIEVSAESKDGKKQYDTATAFVTNVKPGQTALDDSAMFTKKIPTSAVVVLGSVDRSESL